MSSIIAGLYEPEPIMMSGIDQGLLQYLLYYQVNKWLYITQQRTQIQGVFISYLLYAWYGSRHRKHTSEAMRKTGGNAAS